MDFLKIEESDPVNIHFDASGYSTSNAILNMGPVFVILVISPIYIGILYLLSKCCCFAKVRDYFSRVLKKTLFNRMIMFVEGIMLLVATCAWINIYQVYSGAIKSTNSYYFSYAILAATCLYSFAICIYLLCVFSKLKKGEVKDRVGAAYESMRTIKYRKSYKSVITVILALKLRLLTIGSIITFTQGNPLVQFSFVSFSSLVIIALIGVFRPFESN